MSLFMMVISTLFILSLHPLMSVMTLLLLTMILAHFFIIMTKLPWISYIIILMIVSGMMIMFVYMASLTPNEPKILMYKKMNLFLYVYLLLMSLILLTNPFYYFYIFHDYNSYNISTLFFFPFVMIFLILYLFLLLFILLIIIPLNYGPLRSYDK